ncbi:MAG: ribulose-phosphate 3-epimerase [bacterium]
MNSVKVVPSVLSMDFSCIESEMKKLPGSIDMLHLDVMDGNFVENITFGPKVIKTIKKCTDKKLDAHLMIADPEKYADDFIDAGVSYISFHIETVSDPRKLIEHISSRGVKPGLAVNPPTDIKTVEPYLPVIDYVLVMSVNPGFAGQSFISGVLEKVRYLKKKQDKLNFSIEIDGGINSETAKEAVSAGAQWLVTGSYFFKHQNLSEAVRQLTQ